MYAWNRNSGGFTSAPLQHECKPYQLRREENGLPRMRARLKFQINSSSWNGRISAAIKQRWISEIIYLNLLGDEVLQSYIQNASGRSSALGLLLKARNGYRTEPQAGLPFSSVQGDVAETNASWGITEYVVKGTAVLLRHRDGHTRHPTWDWTPHPPFCVHRAHTSLTRVLWPLPFRLLFSSSRRNSFPQTREMLEKLSSVGTSLHKAFPGEEEQDFALINRLFLSRHWRTGRIGNLLFSSVSGVLLMYHYLWNCPQDWIWLWTLLPWQPISSNLGM